ncbi:MAG: type II secretion system secretin GspD [Deltaproteobacteria bacterium]|nr:type II secretion system secretin GspD [Deltaproteobacteria bacterium]
MSSPELSAGVVPPCRALSIPGSIPGSISGRGRQIWGLRNHGLAVFFTAALTLSAFVSDSAAAPSSAKPNDFGAETIEEETPLPVDQVEERATKAPAAITNETVRTPPTDSELAALPSGPNDEVTAILNVRDVEIAALVKSFSKLTKRNYIVDSNVKGKVTIHLATPVTIPDALKILDSVLLLKGFTTVPVGDNTWKVIVAKDARQTTIPTMAGESSTTSDALVTQLIRLRHVKAPDLQQTLQQFISKEGVLTASTSTNALILIDSSANIERLRELVQQLDVPALDQDITIIPMKYAEAKDVADKINEILGQREGDGAGGGANAVRVTRPAVRPAGAPPIQPINPAGGAAMQAGLTTGGEDRQALPLKVIADERTNSIIVVADQELTLKVRALAEQLDSEIDRSGGRFFVYRLKHADAEELAGILGAVISGSASERSTGSQTTGSSLSRSQERDRARGGRGSLGRDRSFGGAGGTGAADRGTTNRATTGDIVSASGRVNFEGEVSVAADPSTNSLIVNASRTDFLRLKEVIDQLDIKRSQVLVEATILEVSLTKDEGMGIEFQATGATDEGGVLTQTNYGGLTNLLTNPSRLNDLTIAAASTCSLTLPGGLTIPSQAFLISAVSSNQNVNVLSSPTILTTDNQEAEIIVGENVPFVTSTSTNDTNLNNTFNQIDRQDVGITLRITPQIGVGSFVSLKIFVEISNVVPTTRNDPNGPTTSIRTTETNVEVKSGQMVVTGGLISDSMTESTRGVPFWKDIPVLGNFFRRDDENQRRTNLLIFITPRVVSDQFVAREVTIERRDAVDKEINRRQVEPDRREVLHSDRIDRVTELEDASEGETLPTTITPPRSGSGTSGTMNREEQAALERTKRALDSLTEDVQIEEGGAGQPPLGLPPERAQKRARPQVSQNGDTIDITVAPRLPSVPGAAPKQESPAKMRTSSAPAPAASRGYVVLRALGGSDGGVIGLVVPGERGTPSGDFFQIGRRYTASDAKGTYICLGRYASEAEASKVHSELSSPDRWNTLSPEETLQLGSGSWAPA